jgi:hypothetical protein
VELLESTVVQGGIRVNVLQSQSLQQPPSAVEVPVGRDVLLTATGGDGEAGDFGGNGENGSDGEHGTAATRTTDATVSIPLIILAIF